MRKDPFRLAELRRAAILDSSPERAYDEITRLLATSLVQADLWGHPSHGVMRLPWYAARLKSGVMQATTQAQTVMDAGAVAVLDGADGIGRCWVRRPRKRPFAARSCTAPAQWRCGVPTNYV